MDTCPLDSPVLAELPDRVQRMLELIGEVKNAVDEVTGRFENLRQQQAVSVVLESTHPCVTRTSNSGDLVAV